METKVISGVKAWRARDRENYMQQSSTGSSFLVFTAVHFSLAWLFIAVPRIDIWFSSYFYHPSYGFLIGTRSSKKVLPFLTWTTVMFIDCGVALMAVNWLRQRKRGLGSHILLTNLQIMYLLLTLALGNGFLINTLFKSNWGRARPINVSEFGGTRSFSPAYVLADQCQRNCSFASGDAALGYYLVTFVFIAKKSRRVIAAGAVLLGSAFGLIRIAQGAHFLSDVIFAGFLIATVAWLLSFILLGRHEWPRTPKRLVIAYHSIKRNFRK